MSGSTPATGGREEEPLTKRRTKANAKENTMGPARSASSIIFALTRASGLSTVRLFCKICDGLIPSSAP